MYTFLYMIQDSQIKMDFIIEEQTVILIECVWIYNIMMVLSIYLKHSHFQENKPKQELHYLKEQYNMQQ